MAMARKDRGMDGMADQEGQAPQPAAQQERVPFNVWFSALVHNGGRGVKAHHMSAVRAHFGAIGIGESATPDDFEAGLRHYGK